MSEADALQAQLETAERLVYTNKRGEVPIKKWEHIEHLAELLQVNSDQLESLEKVNKSVLVLLTKRLSGQT